MRDRRDVYACGLCFQGKCNYISLCESQIISHVAGGHGQEKPIEAFKIVHYPCCKLRTRYKCHLMTYSQLKKRDKNLAKKVLDHHTCHWSLNSHLCGLVLTGKCNYISSCPKEVHTHIKSFHPEDTLTLTITEYPE